MAFQNIGKAIALLRQDRSLSQADFADSCRIGRAQLSRYEAGKELMKLATLERILVQLAVTPEGFFRVLASLGDSPPAPPEAPATLPPPGCAAGLWAIEQAAAELARAAAQRPGRITLRGAVMKRRQSDADRAQTGVRMEKRLLNVCKALAALYDITLAEFFEDLVRGALAGRQPLSDAALVQAAELMRIYGLEPGEHAPAFLGASGDGEDSPP